MTDRGGGGGGGGVSNHPPVTVHRFLKIIFCFTKPFSSSSSPALIVTVWTGCGPPLVPLQQRRWDSDRPPGEQQILGFIRDKGDDQGGAEASGARRSLKRDLGGVLPVPHGECPPTPPYASVALHPHPHRVCWVYVCGGWGVSSLPAVALKPVNPVSQASRACGWGVGGSRRNAGYCSRLRAHACVGPAIAEQAPSRRRRFAADRLPQTPPG